MRIVVVESPFAGRGRGLMRLFSAMRNREYARAAVRDCILRGEAPACSHLLYTQPGILRDEDPVERRIGIACGHAFFAVAEAVVVYTDLGISSGMRQGIDNALLSRCRVEYRSLPDWKHLEP